MIDLEDRLHALAEAIDVPPTSAAADVARGRRLRRRRQWTVTGGAALAAASVIVALAWGSGPASRVEPVGPADRLSELRATATDKQLHDLLVDRLGIEPAAPYVLGFVPSYDRLGRPEMLVPSVVVRDDRTAQLRELSARVARSWGVTEWRDMSCHPGCSTYDLDGRRVEVGRYARQWGWATQRADGTVVVLLLPARPEVLGIEQQQIDAFLRDASL